MRNKLILILREFSPELAEKIADYLLAKGWVHPTRCKNCKRYQPGFIRAYLGWCSAWETAVNETGFCHHGEPGERKENAEWQQ